MQDVGMRGSSRQHAGPDCRAQGGRRGCARLGRHPLGMDNLRVGARLFPRF